MPKVSIYNQEGKTTGELELSAAHFGVKVNSALVHEAVVAQAANRRRAIANTKGRGEVSGGGKKPWTQKGTGRARHGSTRSPIWVGGGVTFGPTSARNFSKKMNRKARQKALFMVLSDKVTASQLLVLEAFTPADVKTKALATLLSKLPVKRTTLYVASASNPNLVRMARNLKSIQVVTPNSLSVEDVLNVGSVVFEKDAVPAFEKVYHATA
jgi:large subunit ribosomal protein L4